MAVELDPDGRGDPEADVAVRVAVEDAGAHAQEVEWAGVAACDEVEQRRVASCGAFVVIGVSRSEDGDDR